MMNAPIARIILRYLVGLTIGADYGNVLAGDPDVVTIVAMAIGAGVESIYALAKRKGWAT